MSPQPAPIYTWKHERDLRDAKAGLVVQVYVRSMPPRDPQGPPVIQRSYQIGSIDPNGQVRRHFYTRTQVDPQSGIVTVHPFPVDALRTLVAQVEREHQEEQQARVELLRASTKKPIEPQRPRKEQRR